MQTMMEEMESLRKNRTWQLENLSEDARPIGSKWVFTRKKVSLEQGGVRYKARLVDKYTHRKQKSIIQRFSLQLSGIRLSGYC